MQTYETLKHTAWECKYHIVFIPEYRKKALFGQIRRELGPVFRVDSMIQTMKMD